MARSLTAIVRPDTANQLTVIFHDEDGNELGSLDATRTPHGVSVNLWHGYDALASTVSLRESAGATS